MTKFKDILMSRQLDSEQSQTQLMTHAAMTPHPNQWTSKPFGSLSVPQGREHGLVSSSTFSPSPDRRSPHISKSRVESDECESEDDRCSPSPVMDLTTAVTDIRSQRVEGFSNSAASNTESLATDDQKNVSRTMAHIQNYRSHDADWDVRAVAASKQQQQHSLPPDSQHELSSVNSPSECSSMSMNDPLSPMDSQSRKRKRRAQPIPEDCKDDAYWERRKRNNESAKRSREMRRMKEQQTTMRVIYLEQDNLRLKTEVDMLRSELEKVREILYTRSGNFH